VEASEVAAAAGSRTYLDSIAATRLAELATARDYPAQAPVAVAVEINRPGLVERRGLTDTERAARQRYVEEAWNEERLVAGAALLHWEGAAAGQRPPIILLQAATFLRVWNQEEPWFPGDPAPTRRELLARFGLAGIEFQENLPESWRVYHLRHLARSLTDLQ